MTMDTIYTPIFSFFGKKVVNIVNSELGPVSKEKPANFIFYCGIYAVTSLFTPGVKKYPEIY